MKKGGSKRGRLSGGAVKDRSLARQETGARYTEAAEPLFTESFSPSASLSSRFAAFLSLLLLLLCHCLCACACVCASISLTDDHVLCLASRTGFTRVDSHMHPNTYMRVHKKRICMPACLGSKGALVHQSRHARPSSLPLPLASPSTCELRVTPSLLIFPFALLSLFLLVCLLSTGAGTASSRGKESSGGWPLLAHTHTPTQPLIHAAGSCDLASSSAGLPVSREESDMRVHLHVKREDRTSVEARRLLEKRGKTKTVGCDSSPGFYTQTERQTDSNVRLPEASGSGRLILPPFGSEWQGLRGTETCRTYIVAT